MRYTTTLHPARSYENGGLVVQREPTVTPAFQSFWLCWLLISGRVTIGALPRLERKV
jgi:hypothetical protein